MDIDYRKLVDGQVQVKLQAGYTLNEAYNAVLDETDMLLRDKKYKGASRHLKEIRGTVLQLRTEENVSPIVPEIISATEEVTVTPNYGNLEEGTVQTTYNPLEELREYVTNERHGFRDGDNYFFRISWLRTPVRMVFENQGVIRKYCSGEVFFRSQGITVPQNLIFGGGNSLFYVVSAEALGVE